MVCEQGDDVAAEAALSAGLGHPQGVEEIALCQCLMVGVVRAYPGQSDQAADSPVQLAAGAVVERAAQERGGAPAEELQDARAHGYTADTSVHLFILVPRVADPVDVAHAHGCSAVVRDVDVVGRVLPFEDRGDRCGPVERARPPRDSGRLLQVTVPERDGAVDGAT
ncbi:hypothetical protein Airi02_084700 [Actinoallomurus iriomotensis]|uniref:Uncharacterized protein n=1 Tax=Actinoallomurus iriomotensis TaxID=478107 RepID=A0A9W6SBE7_9ACTN|nr:hypothetical protein Airi02_084700 [Actinoallomurus iriomotensis]